MKKWLLLVLLIIAAVLAPANAVTLTSIKGTPIRQNILVNPQGKIVSLKSVPTTGVPVTPNPEEAFNNSKILISLSPVYKVSGAGSAFMPYTNIMVVSTGTTARTPLFYDPQDNLFVTISTVETVNLNTVSTVDSYTPPAGKAALFTVDSDGHIHIFQTFAAYQGSLASVVLCPAGVASQSSTAENLYLYPLTVYPNGTYAVGAYSTRYVYTNGTTRVVSYGYFSKGQPSEVISHSGLSKILNASYPDYKLPVHGYFDDIYCANVGGSWVFAVTGEFLSPINYTLVTPDGYTLNLSSPLAPPYAGDIMFIPTSKITGDVINGSEIFFTQQTKIYDADIEVPVYPNYWVMASNARTNDLCLLDLSAHSANPYTGLPIKRYSSVVAHPIYIAGLSTLDGRYVFLLKVLDNKGNSDPWGEPLPVALEIWKHDGDSLTLIKTLNYTLTLPSETTQPRSMEVISKEGCVEILPLPGGLIFYNKNTHELRLVGFNGSFSGRLAAVNPGGSLCVLGDTVYQINYLLDIPAIVYEGNVQIYHGAKDVYLGSPVVYKIPSDTGKYGYVMRALSGKVIIGQIYSKKQSLNLITDPVIGNGRLWEMYKRGLIKTFQYTSIPGNGIVTDQKVVEGSTPSGNPDPSVINYVRYHELKPWAPYIAEANVGSAIDIQIPLTTKIPISQMSKLYLNYTIAYGTIVPEYTLGKFLGFEFNEFGIGIGGSIVGPLLWKALLKYAPRLVVDQIPDQAATDVELLGAGRVANTVLTKVSPIVGIATVVDGVAGYFLNMNALHSTQMQTYLMVAPEFTDNVGNKYTAVTLVLPGDANVKKWMGYAEDVLNKAGFKNYVIQVKIVGTNKQEYLQTLAHLPRNELEKLVDIKQAYSALLAKYGASLSKLKLTRVHLYIATLTTGRTNLWDWVTGGFKFQVITVVKCYGIHAQGVIPAQTITNPRDICDILNPVYINGVPVNLTPSSEGAVASFVLPAKCQYVTIQVHKPYYAAMTTSIRSQLIAPLHNDKPGLYETNFTYSWKYCFNESKIMFISMPYKMVDAYETVYTTHGNEPVNMTPYMSFMGKLPDSSSPTGWRYYYGTTTKKDLRLIDPHNAGLMEPQKRYWIQYWYEPPPVVMGDVSIHVMFNGTTLSSTLPRHARVIINSSRPQTVYGYLQVIVGYEDQQNHQFHTVDTHTYDFALRVGANGSTYKEWDIQKYVGEAIHQYALGKVGYVKLVGKITKAEYDSVKTNDEDSLVYYPPSTLTKTKPIVLTIDVMNAQTHSPVAGAKVVFDNSSTYTTNAAGLVNISTTSGYHSVVVSATGYYTKKTGVLAYTNMTFNVYLLPVNGNYVILPPNGTNPNPTWVAPNGTTGNGTPPGAPPLPVGKNNTTGWTNMPILYNTTNHTYLLPVEVVVQYLNGMPVQGATVKFLNTTTGAIISTVETDGTGYAYTYVPEYYNLTINVTYTSANYTSQKTVFVDHPLIIPFTLPINSKYFEPEVAVNNVSIWIHMGLGEIPQGLKMAPVYHSVDSWFYTNVPQNITFEVWLVNTKTNETVASGTFTVHLHKGFQRVREFIPVNVSNFTTCQVFCKITKYEYDTNPYNNMAVGNVVTFRPWIDIYPTIVWFPVKQKTEFGLLPGDTIKVCIGVHVPKGVHVPDIHVDYRIRTDMVGKHRMKTIQSRTTTLNSLGQVTTIWYNYTMQLPWTDKVVVNASINNTYDLSPDNNNFSVVIPLSPDAQCEAVYVQSLAVSAGAVVPVRVTVRSNYVNVSGTIAIIDLTAGNESIGDTPINITAPIQSFVVSVKVPSIHSKISEQHTWMAYVNEMNDVYQKDNTKTFTVTIFGFPSWIVLVLVFLVVVVVLVLLRHLLTIRPPRKGRYFKRVDGEGRDSFGAAKIGYKRGKGRYFQKFK